MIADLTFEARLVDAIALREAARRWLNPRRRRILRCRGEGWTLREIAQQECVSVERIRQEELKSFVILRKPQAGLGGQIWLPPKPVIMTKPSGFDLAAFLRHMHFLIARKRQLAAQAAEAEAAEAEAFREAREREAEFDVLRGVVRDQQERELALEREARERAEWQEKMRREEEAEQRRREEWAAYQERVRVERQLREALDEREWERRHQEDAHWSAQLDAMMEEARRHQGEMTPAQWQKYAWLQKLRQTYGTEMAARYIGFPTIAAALRAGGAAS